MTNKGTLVKYKKYEIICKSAQDIYNFRQDSKKYPLESIVLSGFEVYTNISKGDKAKDEDLENSFNSKNIDFCISEIIHKGNFKLTTNEKKQLMDNKRYDVIGYIQRYFVNPATKTQYLTEHIDEALKKSKFKIDPLIPTDILVNKHFSKLNSIILLKKITIEAVLILPYEYMEKTKSLIKRYCSIVEQRYLEKYEVDIVIIPGDMDTLINGLQNITNGEFDLKF